mmetsp:Transcript_40487/g.59477  ORF Transcript_40487/g.59477 Transcript_40487/m.59477 type:complete len:154 (-) Transcript_40487:537-998(-)
MVEFQPGRLACPWWSSELVDLLVSNFQLVHKVPRNSVARYEDSNPCHAVQCLVPLLHLALVHDRRRNGWSLVGMEEHGCVGLLLFSAIGPGALADLLQQKGQKEVSATEANVLLSAEPVFTAVCARVLLGETTSATENFGGGLILLGALLAFQ